MLKAIFFSRFHPERGPIILHQVPSGSILRVPSSASPTSSPLLDFSSISDYIIPRQEFCDQLMTVCTNGHRVIGHPVRVTNPQRYARNEYIFNFGVVLEEGTDMRAYVGVVRKMARLFRDLEVQTQFLSRDEKEMERANKGAAGGESWDGEERGSRVYALCEMVLEDLNNYGECMIPIGAFLLRTSTTMAKLKSSDETNTLNLKLFPARAVPPSVRPWHVPLCTVRLEDFADSSWDLTMLRIIPYIDGINSVSKIAFLADADIGLARKAIAHLIYYGVCLLLDIFHFSAIYAPTAELEVFFTDSGMQLECANYVSTTGQAVAADRLLTLYSRLRQGLSVADWCMANAEDLGGIDVRRLLTFGVIKGFLYRVHKYAMSSKGLGGATEDSGQSLERSIKTRANDSFTTTSSGTPGSGELDVSVMKFLDGTHCFDEICTELQLAEPEILQRLKTIGDIHIIHR